MAFNSLTPNAVRGGRGPLDVKPFRGIRWVSHLNRRAVLQAKRLRVYAKKCQSSRKHSQAFIKIFSLNNGFSFFNSAAVSRAIMHRSLLRLTRAIVFAINSKCFFVIFLIYFLGRVDDRAVVVWAA